VRNGFTIDGCIHWLVGSSSKSSFHDIWEEVGILPGREFINMDIYFRHEAADGRVVTFYADIDRLEKHLLEFSPADAVPIREFISGIRMCLVFDTSGKNSPFLLRTAEKIKLLLTMAVNGKNLKKWMKTTISDFTERLKDPVLKDAFTEMWIPEFSMFFMLFTFAWLHNKNAGYPLGGSMPLSKALEKRYLDLGGEISYKSKVEKIVTEDGKATGVLLSDGSFHPAGRVISAADGHTTLFGMLDGKFISPAIQEQYDKWPTFHSLLFFGLGINRSFEEIPPMVSGMSFPLPQPVEIAGKTISRLSVHPYQHDPTLAPPGKTIFTVMLESDYRWWKNLAGDRKAYVMEKENALRKVIELLELRFPGISGQVEMTNVATPVTFERYTGNWKGSFEGWLITPENSGVVMKPMEQTIPGLKNFYMCGQWVEPGGGLPTGVSSGRRLISAICREDRRKFVAARD
jgi:phytoene dehydrogenase-like protein